MDDAKQNGGRQEEYGLEYYKTLSMNTLSENTKIRKELQIVRQELAETKDKLQRAYQQHGANVKAIEFMRGMQFPTIKDLMDEIRNGRLELNVTIRRNTTMVNREERYDD